MSEVRMTDEKKSNGWVKWLIVLIILMALGIIIWLTFRPSESYVESNIENSKISSLKCNTSEIKDAFFDFSTATNSEHEIKETFRDGKLDILLYTSKGVYDSGSVAETMSAGLHGKYNKYMAERSLTQGSLDPNFSVNGNEVKVSLYAKRNELNTITAEFFFINTDEFQRLGSRTIEEMKKYYENIGFSCEIDK